MSRVEQLKKSIEQVEKRVQTERRLVGLETENLGRSLKAAVRSPQVLAGVFAGATLLGFLALRRKRRPPERRHHERRSGKKGSSTKQAGALVSLWASLGTLRQIWKFAAPYLYRMQAERAARRGAPAPAMPVRDAAPVPPPSPVPATRYRGNGDARPGT